MTTAPTTTAPTAPAMTTPVLPGPLPTWTDAMLEVLGAVAIGIQTTPSAADLTDDQLDQVLAVVARNHRRP